MQKYIIQLVKNNNSFHINFNINIIFTIGYQIWYWIIFIIWSIIFLYGLIYKFIICSSKFNSSNFLNREEKKVGIKLLNVNNTICLILSIIKISYILVAYSSYIDFNTEYLLCTEMFQLIEFENNIGFYIKNVLCTLFILFYCSMFIIGTYE